MRIQLIAVGDRMPGWVAQGYHAYAKRLPRECQLVLRKSPRPSAARTPTWSG